MLVVPTTVLVMLPLVAILPAGLHENWCRHQDRAHLYRPAIYRLLHYHRVRCRIGYRIGSGVSNRVTHLVNRVIRGLVDRLLRHHGRIANSQLHAG